MMQSLSCKFCEERIQFEKPPKTGQLIKCPVCQHQYEVASIDPLQIKPDGDPFAAEWENPEKQARSKRLELRTKLEGDEDEDIDVFDEEPQPNGRYTVRMAGKRAQRPKRIRGYVYDDESFFDD
jgi:hypothetical protein